MRLLLGCTAIAFSLAASPVLAKTGPGDGPVDGDALAPSAARAEHIPVALDAGQREAYRAAFAAIRAGRWTDAQIGLDAMTPGPLHAIARAELYTAKGSPRVDGDALVQLLNTAPELPEAETLARLAKARGAADLPPLPAAQALVWQLGTPRRVRAHSVKSDQIAADLAAKMLPLVKGDRAAEAQALLDTTVGLSPEAQTEWRQKVAWMYFLTGDDATARAQAALAADGSGDWAIQGRWVGALAAWRSGDYAAAETAFEGVAARAADIDLRAAALYWASRADIAAGRPDKVAARLTGAAQYGESFYGQLARQALALKDAAKPASGLVGRDWALLDKRPNVRVAAALAEIGEDTLADQVIRQQARIGAPAEFASLVRLAEALDLPATTVWLAHNCPAGVTAAPEARFPVPSWAPDKGWARRQGAGLRPHARGIGLPREGDQPRRRLWPDADHARRRHRLRARERRRDRQGRADPAVGQHGDRPAPSRAAARYGRGDRRAAAQGDRRLQRRAQAGRRMERERTRRRRSAALYREHPLLGDARLRHHGAAQLLGLSGERRQGRAAEPRRAGAGTLAALSRPVGGERGAARRPDTPNRRDRAERPVPPRGGAAAPGFGAAGHAD